LTPVLFWPNPWWFFLPEVIYPNPNLNQRWLAQPRSKILTQTHHYFIGKQDYLLTYIKGAQWSIALNNHPWNDRLHENNVKHRDSIWAIYIHVGMGPDSTQPKHTSNTQQIRGWPGHFLTLPDKIFFYSKVKKWGSLGVIFQTQPFKQITIFRSFHWILGPQSMPVNIFMMFWQWKKRIHLCR